MVFELVKKAFDEGKYCVLVALDMKNEYNIEAFIAKQTPNYIFSVIFDYFRKVDEEQYYGKVSARVCSGSSAMELNV